MLLLAGSVVIASLQLAGSYVISRKRAAGWVISMLTCTLAIPYDALTRQYGFIVTSVISFAIAVRAFRQWSEVTNDAG